MRSDRLTLSLRKFQVLIPSVGIGNNPTGKAGNSLPMFCFHRKRFKIGVIDTEKMRLDVVIQEQQLL